MQGHGGIQHAIYLRNYRPVHDHQIYDGTNQIQRMVMPGSSSRAGNGPLTFGFFGAPGRVSPGGSALAG
jgi:hypothetical protein